MKGVQHARGYCHHYCLSIRLSTVQWLWKIMLEINGDRKMNETASAWILVWTFLQPKRYRAQRHLIYVVRTNEMARNGQKKKKGQCICRDMQNELLLGFHVCTHVWGDSTRLKTIWVIEYTYTYYIQILTVAATQLPAGPCRQSCECVPDVRVRWLFFRFFVWFSNWSLKVDCKHIIYAHKLWIICLVLWYRHKIQDPKVRLNEIV